MDPNYGSIKGGAAPPYTEKVSDPEAPPNYTEAANTEPPSSYDTWYGQLRGAKEKSSGIADFLKNVCAIIFGTIGFTILTGCVPVAMIVIGAMNVDNCKLERYIPIWLIVAGSVSAFMLLCGIIKKGKAKCDGRDPNEEEGSLLGGLIGLIGCFSIAWFFAGNVWVYRNYPPPDVAADNEKYCDPVTYYFAFCIITTGYILPALICCCFCCQNFKSFFRTFGLFRKSERSLP